MLQMFGVFFPSNILKYYYLISVIYLKPPQFLRCCRFLHAVSVMTFFPIKKKKKNLCIFLCSNHSNKHREMKLPTGLKTAQLLNKNFQKKWKYCKVFVVWYLYISLGETLKLPSISSLFLKNRFFQPLGRLFFLVFFSALKSRAQTFCVPRV